MILLVQPEGRPFDELHSLHGQVVYELVGEGLGSWMMSLSWLWWMGLVVEWMETSLVFFLFSFLSGVVSIFWLAWEEAEGLRYDMVGERSWGD